MTKRDSLREVSLRDWDLIDHGHCCWDLRRRPGARRICNDSQYLWEAQRTGWEKLCPGYTTFFNPGDRGFLIALVVLLPFIITIVESPT